MAKPTLPKPMPKKNKNVIRKLVFVHKIHLKNPVNTMDWNSVMVVYHNRLAK